MSVFLLLVVLFNLGDVKFIFENNLLKFFLLFCFKVLFLICFNECLSIGKIFFLCLIVFIIDENKNFGFMK